MLGIYRNHITIMFPKPRHLAARPIDRFGSVRLIFFNYEFSLVDMVHRLLTPRLCLNCFQNYSFPRPYLPERLLFFFIASFAVVFSFCLLLFVLQLFCIDLSAPRRSISRTPNFIDKYTDKKNLISLV